MLYKAKATGNYINSSLALRDALTSGYDEALILGTDNSVNEGSGENIFLIKDNKLITPELLNCFRWNNKKNYYTL